MKNKKDFKYTTTFCAQVCASKITNQDNFEASASFMSRLKDYAPYLYKSDSPDLFGVAMEIALVNQFNENGDGVTSEDCINMAYSFRNKQLNIEHDRSTIVGHVVNASFCERAFGKEIWEYDFRNSDEVFSIVLSGVVYKLANEEFSKLISNVIDGEMDIYGSWEVGFDEYDIALGNSRLVKDCEIVSGESEKESLKKHLVTSGGSGKLPDGRYVQRLLKGQIVPLGGGFTLNPAAKVKPIHIYDPVTLMSNDKKECEEAECGYAEKNRKNIEKISQSKKEDVTLHEKEELLTKKGNDMDEKQIKKLVEETLASKKAEEKTEQETVASIVDVIGDAVKQSSEQYKLEKEAEAKEKADIQASLEEKQKEFDEVQAKAEELEAKFAESEKQLGEIKAEQDKLKAQATFDARMDSVKDKYELDENVTAIVAKRLSAIETDEDFDGLMDEFATVLAHLDKEAIASKKKSKESKASAEDTAEKVVEKGGKEDDSGLTNTSASASETEETIFEKFSKAFTKETVEIK